MPTLAELLTVHVPPAFTASLLNNDPAQAKLLWSGLAKATRSNYFGAVTNYEEICKQDGLADWPATSESLANFVTSRAYPNNTTLRAQLRPPHSEATSQHCAPTTLTINSASRYSTTMPSSLGSLAVRNACSLGRKRRDYRLPKTYSGGCLSSGKRLKNWTRSTCAPHGP
jgi:hypothetical protein